MATRATDHVSTHHERLDGPNVMFVLADDFWWPISGALASRQPRP